MHTFTSFLNESIAPEQFYVSVSARRTGIVDALCAGELIGVQGISGTADNINQFFNFGSILLAMPRTDTLALNTLEEVEYDNVDYLCRDNLATLTRICATGSAEMTMSYVLSWVPTEQRTKELANLIEREIHSRVGMRKLLTNTHINSFDELVKGLSDFYQLADVAHFEDVLRQTIFIATGHFKEEQEWRVSGILHIPASTKIYVPNIKILGLEKLHKQYRVRVLDYDTQSRIKSWVKKY